MLRRARRSVRRPRAERGPEPRDGSRPSDRSQFLLGRSQGDPHAPWPGRSGRGLADRLLDRHVAEEGRVPTSVGLVVWGTSAMRTGGDDVAEALALLGVRPVWDGTSGRVTGVELHRVPPSWAGPVSTSRCGCRGSSATPSPTSSTCWTTPSTLAAASTSRATPSPPPARASPGSSGPSPGAYGSGILTVLESGNWRDDEDLADGLSRLGRVGLRAGWSRHGRPPTPSRRRLAGIEVAVKNQDNREHDIFDSDDYLQDHGGMVATVRALSGRQPKAVVRRLGRSRPPRVRSLAEEAARVVRTPGASTRSGSRPCSGTATRGRSRWRPPSTTSSATTPPPAWSRTGCTSG